MTAEPEPTRPPQQSVTDADSGAWPPAGESRYRRVAPGQTPDQPFEVRIEFVVLDGPAGQELARRQARIMRKVLRWIAEHPDPANP
jgi:hypothetical protein